MFAIFLKFLLSDQYRSTKFVPAINIKMVIIASIIGLLNEPTLRFFGENPPVDKVLNDCRMESYAGIPANKSSPTSIIDNST